jgi:hypothetical protein
MQEIFIQKGINTLSEEDIEKEIIDFREKKK